MMRFIRALHKWLSLVIGAQMVLWLVSGLIMSLLDARVVAGEDLIAYDPDVSELTSSERFVQPHQILALLRERSVQTMQITRQLGFWVWRVQTDAGVTLYDARNGQRLEVGEREARRAAESGYFGDGKIADVTLLTTPTLEARGHALPLWRVAFDDERRTTYYIGADEGRIVERRNDAWRVFDVFWMLHTMDYSGRDDFNTPWVIAVGFAAVWLVLSGTLLLIKSFAR